MCKEQVVEDLQVISTGDFADGARVEATLTVGIRALDKNATVAQALNKDLSPHIIQVDTFRREEGPRLMYLQHNRSKKTLVLNHFMIY